MTVTQDRSPCLCSERHDEYLFGRAKTGGLGQVTKKKKNKKSPKGINPAVVLSALGVRNILRPRKIQAEVVSILKVGDLSYF